MRQRRGGGNIAPCDDHLNRLNVKQYDIWNISGYIIEANVRGNV